MNTSTLIHIGSEVVIVAALSFYFQKQLQQLRQENLELLERVNRLENIVIRKNGGMMPQHNHIEETNTSMANNPLLSMLSPMFAQPMFVPPSQQADVQPLSSEDLDDELDEVYEDYDMNQSSESTPIVEEVEHVENDDSTSESDKEECSSNDNQCNLKSILKETTNNNVSVKRRPGRPKKNVRISQMA